MAGLSSLGWFRDFLPELLLLAALFALLWNGSVNDFHICDGQTKFSLNGPAKSEDEVYRSVSSGHHWGANCKDQSQLNAAGFTRTKSSQCIAQSKEQLDGLQAGLLAASAVMFFATVLRDAMLWQSASATATCMRLFTSPATVLGFLAALALGITVAYYGVKGFTCKSNDGDGYVHLTVTGNMSPHHLLVVIVILLLRLSAICLDTLVSMCSGSTDLILYRARGLSKQQLATAYGAESDPLLPPTSNLGEAEVREEASKRAMRGLFPWVDEFYRIHNPNKRSEVPKIITSYVGPATVPGDEDQLFKDLQAKYPAQPAPPAPPPAGNLGPGSINQV